MKKKLEMLGLGNVSIVPNFKEIEIANNVQHEVYEKNKVYRVCTFSRVMREKGIEDAVNAVKLANKVLEKNKFSLDIYGPIDSGYHTFFETYMSQFPEYIQYKGVVNPSDSVRVLQEYWLLLFPTYYDGEGLAGTLIDAFASGVPVVASNWNYNRDVVTDKYTGLIVPACDVEKMKDALIWSIEHFDEWVEMKKNCIDEAEKYCKKNVGKLIKELLET